MHITHPFYIDVLLISPQQLVEFIVQHVKTNNSQMERIKKKPPDWRDVYESSKIYTR